MTPYELYEATQKLFRTEGGSNLEEMVMQFRLAGIRQAVDDPGPGHWHIIWFRPGKQNHHAYFNLEWYQAAAVRRVIDKLLAMDAYAKMDIPKLSFSE